MVVPIDSLCKADVARVGGKGANLGELTRLGVPIVPGFVVTAPAYFRFLDEAELRPRAEQLLSGLDVNDSASLDRVAAGLRLLIAGAAMPEEIAAAITAAYAELNAGAVAVRSSATAEDLADASFAGQQETYLNVEGAAEVVPAVQNCWASLFEARAIFYRASGGFGQLGVGIAVVVQRMVQSERSGVMFTVHPVTNDTTQVVIEAVYGLGEAIVSGLVSPDMYVIDKATGALIDKQVTPQEREYVRCPVASPAEDTNHWIDVDWGRRTKQKLTDEEAAQLAAIGQRLEQHFGCPQDIEWAHAGGSFYILQSRAVTTII
ncbi:MAG: PEP/pyruvate-binding domain-containing protein [Dehalococcoidia bacterium]